MPVAVVAGVVGTVAAIDQRNQVKRANKNARKQRDESQAFIEKSIKQARGDLFKLFPAAQESRRRGAEAGLDLFRESIPQQLGAFRGGNIAAQETLIQGLPQIQNAILGRPLDLNFQPRTIQGDLTVPQLPDAVRIDQLGLESTDQPQPTAQLTGQPTEEELIAITNNLRGFGRFGF